MKIAPNALHDVSVRVLETILNAGQDITGRSDRGSAFAVLERVTAGMFHMHIDEEKQEEAAEFLKTRLLHNLREIRAMGRLN